jgi:hypothetical protein
MCDSHAVSGHRDCPLQRLHVYSVDLDIYTSVELFINVSLNLSRFVVRLRLFIAGGEGTRVQVRCSAAYSLYSQRVSTIFEVGGKAPCSFFKSLCASASELCL